MFTVAILFIGLKILIAQRLKVLENSRAVFLCSQLLLLCSRCLNQKSFLGFVAEVRVRVNCNTFCTLLGFGIMGFCAGSSGHFYHVKLFLT